MLTRNRTTKRARAASDSGSNRLVHVRSCLGQAGFRHCLSLPEKPTAYIWV